MIAARLHIALLSLACLTGCSISLDMPDLLPNPIPTASDEKILSEAIFKSIQSMKGSGPAEISNVGPNEAQSGTEKWTICTRAIFDGNLRYYTFFVRGRTVVESRIAVINDRCETRSYSPLG